MNEKKEPRLFVEGHPASDFIIEWWDSLKKNKGDRAELKRCKNLQEIQLTSAYQRCYWQLVKHLPHSSREQMSIIIGLAAHIEDNDNVKKNDQRDNQTHDYFGYQISRGDKPTLSELRFRRLLKIKDRGKLYHFLIQVIRMLGKKVCLLDLLSIAYFWSDRDTAKTKRNLAYKYYEMAKLEN